MITLVRLEGAEARGLHGLCISELAYHVPKFRILYSPHAKYMHSSYSQSKNDDKQIRYNLFHDIVELKFCVVL